LIGERFQQGLQIGQKPGVSKDGPASLLSGAIAPWRVRDATSFFRTISAHAFANVSVVIIALMAPLMPLDVRPAASLTFNDTIVGQAFADDTVDAVKIRSV
jgi:hypothetical protein